MYQNAFYLYFLGKRPDHRKFTDIHETTSPYLIQTKNFERPISTSFNIKNKQNGKIEPGRMVFSLK